MNGKLRFKLAAMESSVNGSKREMKRMKNVLI